MTGLRKDFYGVEQQPPISAKELITKVAEDLPM